MKILAAEFVLPISSEPIEGGAVAIDGERIVAVGPQNEITARFPDASVTDFGVAAILPGFVNCHSHLEITSMRGALDSVEHDFKSWLLKLNDIRSGMSPDDIEAAATLGAGEGARAGVTCFGDIGRCGEAGLSALKSVGLRGVLFQETEFSPDNATAEEDLNKLRSKIDSLRRDATDLVEIGISPHSPYTVSRRLFELIAEYAAAEGLKVTIHAAESAEEKRLLANGEGLFTKFYERVGVQWEVPHCSSIEFLQRTGILATRPLLAHCVTVTSSDIDVIAQTGTTIAHCPKSNAKFGHGYAPFEKFLAAGIAVGLGSDSVASNNVCDLLEEARFAALLARNHEERNGFIGPRDALYAATLGGAKALGLQDKVGTLEAGKCADVAVVSLSELSQSPINDVEAALVFSSNARDVVMTIVNGRTVYESR
ncbi:MAG TPA: amidohydrolase family protein [Pyrinomonadaceae bacterium]|nr:amidohydrolase family protein [Pyrinomonadaceae bacterium]